jgi:hypothetical protein
MSQLSTGLSRQEKRAATMKAKAQAPPSRAPLAVTPIVAGHLLSICVSRVYRLMRTGELENYHSGRSRRITMKSINRYITKQLRAAQQKGARG